MHATDEELVAEAAARDAGAFDQLVGRQTEHSVVDGHRFWKISGVACK